ncbi:MAG: alkaline phosphatase family protein [Rhodospirillaceae bacterium]|nr:alkaline phosphatase family protein [Rhodospirillaceae bacterium]
MSRVLFIGVDAADRDLVARWADAGHLPTFLRLREQGATMDVDVPPVFYVGAVWPSFYTGWSAARHGRYCFKQFTPGTYRAEPVGPDIIPAPSFWQKLDEAGRRTVVIDVPKARLAPLEHGVHVVDWGTHDPERAGFATSPKSLAAEIQARYGEEPVGNCDRVVRTAAGYRQFVRNLGKRIDAKLAMTKHLMATQDWDALAVCFGESHCVGHQCWHLHDDGHERHRPAIASQVGDPVFDIYRALDTAVAALIEAAGADCRVFVLCSHGMGRHYDGGHLLKEALLRINRALPFGRPRSEQRAAFANRGADPAAGVELLPDGLPRPAMVQSFVVPNNDAYAGIRINVVGRELYGRIRPGEEFENYRAALMEQLRAVTIDEGGPPAFASVFPVEEAYATRAASDALPDVLAQWSRAASYHALASPAIGRIEGDYRGVRTGDHRAVGRLHIVGPGIRAASLPSVRTEDIAPTICGLLGVALEDVDGRPIDLAPARAVAAE